MRTFKIIGLVMFILVTIFGWGITYYAKNYKFNKICYKAYPTIEDQRKHQEALKDCLKSSEAAQSRFDKRLENLYLADIICFAILAGLGYLLFRVIRNKKR